MSLDRALRRRFPDPAQGTLARPGSESIGTARRGGAMIQVAALTSGRHVPSARFRVRQHIAPLREAGFDVHERYPRIDKFAALPAWPSRRNDRWAPHFLPWQAMKLGCRVPGLVESWRSDMTWVEREFLPGRDSFERLLRGPVVFDVDDAIWHPSPAAAAAAGAISARADIVLAGNGYLADWFSAHARDVRIVPTAVDSDRFFPAEPRDDGAFVIGWTGSSSTLPYLEAIEEPLRRFLTANARASLLIIADRPPRMPSLADRIRYVPWSPSVEATALQDIDVGLMPLPDNGWTRGKCSFKMLQYMSCGRPVIVSPVGMNEEVLNRGELGIGVCSDSGWYDALSLLAGDERLARRMGEEGRRVIEKEFSVHVISRQIAAVFAEVAA